MDFTALRTQVLALLQREQRLSYRALQRQFALGLILASRVVMGPCWRHKVFVQAFHGGCDRGGICGESLCISRGYLLYRGWQTPGIHPEPASEEHTQSAAYVYAS